MAYINRIGDILGQVEDESLEDTATSVMQKLAAKDADAKRYQWLRDELRNDSLAMNGAGYILIGSELDAAIDKELK